jgi:glycosyltransferase involved in cell wall biosynthesis
MRNAQNRDYLLQVPRLEGTVWPTVSVVIPVLNEERSIAACLEAVVAQDYPAGLVEVLVVDGGSTDGTRAVVERYQGQSARIRLLDNPSGLIPVGLNLGIRASTGAVIARVDARATLDRDYLSRGVGLLHETGANNVGGPVRSVSTGFMGRVLALAMESRFGMGSAAPRYQESRSHEVDTVYLGIYPRAVLATIGLYDEELVRDQDDELNFRLRSRGGRVLMSPTLRTRYMNSPSLVRFARQNFLYGHWKVRVFQKHPRMMNWRHLVPPAFALAVLVLAALSYLDRLFAVALGVILGVYVVGAVGAAVTVGRRGAWRHVPFLPVVFAVLHLSWGLGFLAGMVRFLPRWFRPDTPPPSLSGAVAD